MKLLRHRCRCCRRLMKLISNKNEEKENSYAIKVLIYINAAVVDFTDDDYLIRLLIERVKHRVSIIISIPNCGRFVCDPIINKQINILAN